MKQIKEYEHLRKLYKRSKKGYMVLLVIITFFAALFILLILLSMLSIRLIDKALMYSIPIFLIALILWIPVIFKDVILKSKIKKFTEEEVDRINDAIPYADKSGDFIITRDALIITTGRLRFIPVKNILWVYGEHTHTTSRMYGIKYSESDSFNIIIADKNKRKFSFISYQFKNDLSFLNTTLSKYRRGIFFGYSDQLDQMYSNNFEKMLAISEAADVLGDSDTRTESK